MSAIAASSGAGRVGSLGDGDVRPGVRVGGGERDAYVALGVRHVVGVGHRRVVLAVRLVHRHDVLVAVVVEVGHHQAVAAAQAEPGGGGLVDEVLAPAYVAAVRRPGGRGGVADERLPVGRLRREPREAEEESGAAETDSKPHGRARRMRLIESHGDSSCWSVAASRRSRVRCSRSAAVCRSRPAAHGLTVASRRSRSDGRNPTRIAPRKRQRFTRR